MSRSIYDTTSSWRILVTAEDITVDSFSSRLIIEYAVQIEDIFLRIEQKPFDLILLDCNTGFWLILEHVALFHQKQNIPVIAIVDSQNTYVNANEWQSAIKLPVTERNLIELITFWHDQMSTLDYITAILTKTKYNQTLALTIFKKLFEELPSLIATIKEALKDKRYDAAKQVSHKINGSASFCGLSGIQHAANALEKRLSEFPMHQTSIPLELYFLNLHQHLMRFLSCQNAILERLGGE